MQLKQSNQELLQIEYLATGATGEYHLNIFMIGKVPNFLKQSVNYQNTIPLGQKRLLFKNMLKKLSPIQVPAN